VAQPGGGAGVAEGVGAVGGAVVGHDALHGDGRQRSVDDPPALLAHPRHEKESTMDRHACILVDVHPELRLKVGGLPNPNLAALLRMNNLHSNDS
jgi:hypothetical protein